MTSIVAPPMTLMQLWRLHKCECRGVGSIVAEARAGHLPGVTQFPNSKSFTVTDQRAALTAMRKAV